MLAAYPPAQVYRGDRYRLNFTAGALLSLVSSAGTLALSDAVETIKGQNLLAGIPGGQAGTQWNPPPVMAEKNPDPDPTATKEPERYPDTLRPYCTYFEDTDDRITTVTRMLDYCGLVKLDGEEIHATDLGRAVLTLSEQVEAQEQKLAHSHGRMTPTQQYLAGDSRDTFISPHTVPFPVYPLHITQAVRTALSIYKQTPPPVDGSALEPETVFASVPAVTYAQAVQEGITAPDTEVEYNYGDVEYDNTLPVRRHLYRTPSYRQFLWIALNERATFVLALSGLTPRTLELVGNASAISDPRDRTDPHIRAVKANRVLIKKIKDFAQLVLTGGPESVWVGKPIDPKDVHADCMAFHAAGRPGFTAEIVQASSLAWEAYTANKLTVRDFELAREALREGYKNGLLSKNMAAGTSTIDANEVMRDALAEGRDSPYQTLEDAGAYVERTADQIMREIGVDVDIKPEVSPSGIPFDIRCTHVSTTTNTINGRVVKHQCRARSIGGSGLCERHGGSYLSPEETASLVRASQQKLFAASTKAVEVMADLMLHSTNDAVRLRAAEQVLNRSGLSESRDLTVHLKGDALSETRSAAENVRERLARLSGVEPEQQQAIERKQKAGELSTYGEAIEAEVVELPDH